MRLKTRRFFFVNSGVLAALLDTNSQWPVLEASPLSFLKVVLVSFTERFSFFLLKEINLALVLVHCRFEMIGLAFAFK